MKPVLVPVPDADLRRGVQGVQGISARASHLAQKTLALTWLVLGHSSAALRVFTRMLERWPDDPDALASRSHLLAQTGAVALALDDARRLVALVQDNAAAWFNLGYLFETAERWDEALAAFQRATELAPQLDRAWYGQALVLIRLRRYDQAATALRQTTALQPMSPHGWYQLARVHLDLQQPGETLKIIRHLQGFEPHVAAQLERETGLSAVSAQAGGA